MGPDLHRQVWRRSEQGHTVSSLWVLRTSSPQIAHIAHATKLGPQCRIPLHHCPRRHEPRQPSVQGSDLRTRPPSKTHFTTAEIPVQRLSNRVTRLPSTKPTARSTKPSMTTWSSSPDALRPKTPWNVSAALHMRPSWMLSTRPLLSSLQTDWI